ncbi:hypothetical protein L228DRAFT_285808 [Xylona heveae TC161]|uniref:Sensitive to high expression protein 9, mitochondrial n=1 Tax=Xylona heveae (strain CBS 132557 / TC161) TaxID=1328760 RepID=A0A164ZQI9_XYLHT|nr:hypothetical protein L228DRAFT_285808 [Xylona heveae TC161]KZF19381.1 hypothetical protein L228DRAFT_285808 [Xylona heveae TC161]
MRPLLRHVAKPTFESLITKTLPKSLPRLNAYFPRPQHVTPTACLQCQFRIQLRYYSENRSSSDRESSQAAQDEVKLSNVGATAKPSSKPSEPEIPSASLASNATSDAFTTAYAQTQPPRKDLPSEEEGRRWQLSKKFSHVMDNLQTNIFLAGKTLNDLTGYSGIEALKKEIEHQEQRVRDARRSVHDSKDAYSAAIARRSASQREVNELLQRKHAWSAQDLERFTELYRSDHTNEQTELATQQALTAAEQVAEEAAVQLSRSILARYHEEQIWSDKIRRMSTWGTWGLMGVNVLLFLVFQIGVEPWRRKRLVKGFEEKVMEAIERESSVLAAPKAQSDSNAPNTVVSPSQEQAEQPFVLTDGTQSEPTPGDSAKVEQPAATATADAFAPVPEAEVPLASESSGSELENQSRLGEELPLLKSIKDKAMVPVQYADRFLRDIFSQKEVQLRKVDVTTIALEGTVAGAAFVGAMIMLLRHT